MSAPILDEIPLVVGLSSLPSRLQHLKPTIDSLLSQSKLPDSVLLCLPQWSKRENCAYSLPTWLRDYHPTLRIVECEDDYGPGTKLLGCLQHLPETCCLVLADDDMVYKSFFLEKLFQHQRENPGKSFSYYTYAAGPFIVGQGADGFSFDSRNLSGIKEFAAKALAKPHLRVMDDLWISAFLKSRGVLVESIKFELPDGATVYEISHSINQLRNIEGDLERKRALYFGVQHLLEMGLMGRQEQAIAMIKRYARKLLE